MDYSQDGSWTLYLDESSGHNYWYNSNTGESRWETDGGSSQGSSNTAAASPAVGNPLSSIAEVTEDSEEEKVETQPPSTATSTTTTSSSQGSGTFGIITPGTATSTGGSQSAKDPHTSLGSSTWQNSSAGGTSLAANNEKKEGSGGRNTLSSMLKSGLAADGKSEGSEEDRKSSGKEGGGFVPANLRSRRATINPMYFAKKLQDWSKRAKSRTYAYELESGGGIPVRELLQGMYKIRRDKNIIELLIFFVFLVDLMVIINMIYDTSVANETNMAIEDAFLDEEFPDAIYKKNFYEIKTHGEFWTWLRGPLYNAAYQESWYNDNPYQNGERGYVLHYLRLIGGVQLRQARVTNTSCQERRFVDKCIVQKIDGKEVCVPRFDTLDGTCFAEYSAVDPPFPPFGPPGNETKYKYSTGLSDMDGLEGYGPNYGTGGYVVVLPPRDPDEAKRILDEMFEDQWTDRGTRAVGVTMNFYNTETKLASVVRIMVEFFYSSLVITSARFYTFKIVLYESDTDMIRVACEGLLVMFWIYFLQKEIRRMIVYKPIILYFYRFSNLYEVTILALVLILIIQWIAWRANPLTSEFTVNTTEFVDVFDYAYNFVLITSVAGFTVLVCALKIFKYMSISKKMNALWLTLAMAAPDLIAFLVGFVVLIGGFAFTGQMLYGSLLEDFRTFEKSFSSLLRFPLGDFDYAKLVRARPSITATFFTLYVGMVFLVCMNMIIGIVTLYFEEVHERLKTSDKWKLSTVSFEGHVLQRSLRFVRKYFRFCIKPCLRRKLSQEVASLPTKGDGTGRRDSESPAKALQSLYGDSNSLHTKREGRIQLENQFQKELRRFMRGCMWENNVDLYEYCDDVYKHSGGRNVYLGIHELCMLRESKLPPVGEYGPRIIHKGTPNEKTIPATNAWRLLQLYSKLKKVILVGKVSRHAPDSLRAMTTMRRYVISKINMKGVRQERILCVDVPGRQLLNFTLGMRLKKKIPLSQMTQIELNTVDEKRLTLVFTAVQSAENGDVNVMDKRSQLGDELETQYVCIFVSAEERRDFVRAVLDARKGILSSVHRKDPKLYELVQRFSKGRTRKLKLGSKEVYLSDLISAIQKASRDVSLGLNKPKQDTLRRTVSESAAAFRGALGKASGPSSPSPTPGTPSAVQSGAGEPSAFNEALQDLSETVNTNSATLNSIQGQLARLERLLTQQQQQQ